MCYVEPTSGNSDHPKCTNTPIYCTLCPVSNHGHPHTIWKYTAHLHLISQHAPVDKDSSPTLAVPAQMAVNMFISQAEGEHMGLEASKTDEYRDDFALPDSEAIDPVRSTVKRDRSTSITVTVGISSKRPRRGTYSKVKLV